MNARDVLAFSAGALRGHRLRTALSCVGVAIGVASVVLLTGLGEGARLYVTGEFATLGSNLIIVLPGRVETTGGAPPIIGVAPHDLTLGDAEAARRRLRRVRRVAPLVIGTALGKAGERTRDVSVFGGTAEVQDVWRLKVRTGRFLPPGDAERGARVCVIGSLVQQELFPGRNPLGETLRLGDERFRVIGVLEPRGVALGFDMNEMVVVPVSIGLRMFNRTGLFRIFVEMDGHADVEAGREALRALLTQRHDGEEDFTVLTHDAVLSTFNRLLGMLTAALVGIAAISLGVAGVGIMNVMLVSVAERTREIGLLKALGVTRPQVVTVFLAESALISTLGGLLGLLLSGVLLRVGAELLPAFPLHAPGWAVVAALVVSLTVGLAFGALPARRAARLDPVQALARR